MDLFTFDVCNGVKMLGRGNSLIQLYYPMILRISPSQEMRGVRDWLSRVLPPTGAMGQCRESVDSIDDGSIISKLHKTTVLEF